MIDPDEEHVDRPSAALVVTPRWYRIAMVVVALTVGIYLLSMNQVIFATIFFIAAVVALVADLWWLPRMSRREKARTGTATYGSSTLFGVLYILLGAFSLAATTQTVFGALMLAIGLLNMIAFGPGYLRSRRAR